MKPAPVYIVGTQRSGTTLLYQILNGHPDIYVLNEFWDLYPFVMGEKDSPQDLETLLVSHLGLEGTYLEPEEDAPRDVFEHLELAFERKLFLISKRRWAIKHPRLTYYLDEFADRFPDGKWIFIVRDGRGVVSSYLTRRWNIANAYSGAQLWADQVAIQRRFASRHPQMTHWLTFEQLLEDPEDEVRKICDFLEEPFSQSLLDFYSQTPDTHIHDGNINITRPIQKGMADKWRSRLTPRQIGIVEQVAGETLQAEGYELTGEKAWVSAAHKAAYRLHQEVMTTYWWQKRTRWKGVRGRLTPFGT
jgi:hypothetical protein